MNTVALHDPKEANSWYIIARNEQSSPLPTLGAEPLPEWSPSLREQQQSQRCCDNTEVLWPELTSNFPVSSQEWKKGSQTLFYSFTWFNAHLRTDEGESIPTFSSLQKTPGGHPLGKGISAGSGLGCWADN